MPLACSESDNKVDQTITSLQYSVVLIVCQATLNYTSETRSCKFSVVPRLCCHNLSSLHGTIAAVGYR